MRGRESFSGGDKGREAHRVRRVHDDAPSVEQHHWTENEKFKGVRTEWH